MAKVRGSGSNTTSSPIRSAITPEARENQLISLAVNLAAKQLQDGTASSQVITHYLKLGTEKARLENERLEEENKLLRAKTKALEDAQEMKVMYAEALKAMRNYSGQGEPDDYEEYDYSDLFRTDHSSHV